LRADSGGCAFGCLLGEERNENQDKEERHA
jgi:hypothetical protein